MTGYNKLKNRIRLHFDKLPKNQMKIAEYIIENFDHISFLNVQQIAEATSTNVAAVVRFAQRIGFSGFSELRDEIETSLRNRLDSGNVFPLVKPSELSKDTLTLVANQEITNIGATLQLTERENYNKIIELILNSERVFTAGLGISHLLSHIISYQLNQIGIFSNPLTNSESTFLEQILFMNKNDLIITLSFPPYSKATIEAAKYANENQIKVVSLTNKKSSPISFFSEVSLIIKSENMLFTNSFAAISVLINAIVTECALKNKTKATKWLNELKNVTKRQNITND